MAHNRWLLPFCSFLVEKFELALLVKVYFVESGVRLDYFHQILVNLKVISPFFAHRALPLGH